MSHTINYRRANITALAVLRDGLSLSSGSRLQLLVQEENEKEGKLFERVGESIGIIVKKELFKRDDLINGSIPEPTANRWLDNSSNSGATIFLSEWSPETTSARLSILKRMADHPSCRGVASIPGVTLENLSHCSFNLKQITKYSIAVAANLITTTKCYIKSCHPQNPNKDEILSIPLPKNPVPIISTGRILPRMWGNCPSGETFVLPMPYLASGRVYIDGSLPKRSMEPGEWCLFEFKNGRIQYNIKASSKDLKEYANSLFFKQTGSVLHKNSNVLAEFGVGTNPGIKFLSGNPVFDEKMLGTVHLGIGSNDQFHGPIECKTHHDIVCLKPTLNIDNFDMIYKGKFLLNTKKANKPVGQFPNELSLDDIILKGDVPFSSDLNDLEIADDDYIYDTFDRKHSYTHYTPTVGSRFHIQIANDIDREVIKKIMKTITARSSNKVTIRYLLKKTRIDSSTIKIIKLLSGLRAYGVIKIQK